jgi:hypothetical protein
MNLQEHLSALSTFPATPVLSPSSSPCLWMPLEGVAQLWATFAGTFLSYPAFTVTSVVFSALSLEAGALRQYDHACHSRLNGDDLHARAACEQTVYDLQDASSQWISALYWLEQLASDKQYPLCEDEHASLRSLFSEATKQIQRVGVLTQQIQEACVLGYQQHGMLRHKKGGERS